jgi:hypothetical protein
MSLLDPLEGNFCDTTEHINILLNKNFLPTLYKNHTKYKNSCQRNAVP